jgi:formylglycine-generating enzyme required for sulfatase activity
MRARMVRAHRLFRPPTRGIHGNFDTLDHNATPTSVFAFPSGVNFWGLYDCAGNAWEWTA